MLKKFVAFVTLFVCLSLTVVVAAQNYDEDFNENAQETSPSVVDTLNLLTPEEINDITERIKQIEQKHQVRIGIEFLKNTHGQNIVDTANSLLDKNFLGAPNGGILLLIVMDTRKWRISTDSVMRNRISDADTERIASRFITPLTHGDYYGACISYLEGVDNYLTPSTVSSTNDDIYYEEESSFRIIPEVLIVSAVTALIFSLIFRYALISSMSNVRKASDAREYLDRNSVQITEKNDTYLFTNISRRKKKSNNGGGRGSRGSSGGSSGGGRGSSGGGSHGGSGGSF